MVLDRIKNKLKTKAKQIKRGMSDTVYISIGENCLTDNILDRYNIKSFTTPYSHGRSNLDYIIQIEKDGYQNLLSPNYLYYDFVGEKKVVRNNFYSETDNIYNKAHMMDFEFTYHDVISNKKNLRSLERKIDRIKNTDKKKKIKFIYHYRDNKNKNIELLKQKAKIFLDLYRKRGFKCEFIFFTQEIVKNKEERELIKICNSNDIFGYNLKTLESWAGDNPDVFWALKDDDLLRRMINYIKA